MPRESLKARTARADQIYEALQAEYPDAHCALDHKNAFELAVATILSAQCTDERVNKVTPALFKRFPDAESLAGARLEEVEDLVRSTGFFRNKAKSLVGMAEAVSTEYDGDMPKTMDQLTPLPGIGRKTANVILGNAYGIDEGVVVDTHVKRLTRLLKLTREENPVKIERDLMRLFASERWTMLAHLLIWHGRQVCVARRPRCEDCVVAELCPSSRV